MKGYKDRKTLGEPYKIFHDIVHVGKTVPSSKKRITWHFGFSETEKNYEVVLVHTLTSGKKVG